MFKSYLYLESRMNMFLESQTNMLDALAIKEKKKLHLIINEEGSYDRMLSNKL